VSFPEKLKGVLESMAFCPKCGGPLEDRNDEPSPKDKIKVCPTDKTLLRWEYDGEYWFWMLSIETDEIRTQSVILG
jgi:hypothetical protein